MNYLAHFHLARSDDEWIAGALLGDFVKGPLPDSLPAKLRQGIQLHRRIDAYSDVHPLRAEFARGLPDAYRRYAGILLDVCCDYWLSRYWATYEAQPLAAFAVRIYSVLDARAAQMPAPATRMAKVLAEHDVLTRYGDADMVRATVERIGMRLRRDNPLRHVGADIEQHLCNSEKIFIELYPQLIAQVTKQIIVE